MSSIITQVYIIAPAARKEKGRRDRTRLFSHLSHRRRAGGAAGMGRLCANRGFARRPLRSGSLPTPEPATRTGKRIAARPLLCKRPALPPGRRAGYRTQTGRPLAGHGWISGMRSRCPHALAIRTQAIRNAARPPRLSTHSRTWRVRPVQIRMADARGGTGTKRRASPSCARPARARLGSFFGGRQQSPGRTSGLSKGGSSTHITGRGLFLNHSPGEWFSIYKKARPVR